MAEDTTPRHATRDLRLGPFLVRMHREVSRPVGSWDNPVEIN